MGDHYVYSHMAGNKTQLKPTSSVWYWNRILAVGWRYIQYGYVALSVMVLDSLSYLTAVGYLFWRPSWDA